MSTVFCILSRTVLESANKFLQFKTIYFIIELYFFQRIFGTLRNKELLGSLLSALLRQQVTVEALLPREDARLSKGGSAGATTFRDSGAAYSPVRAHPWRTIEEGTMNYFTVPLLVPESFFFRLSYLIVLILKYILSQ